MDFEIFIGLNRANNKVEILRIISNYLGRQRVKILREIKKAGCIENTMNSLGIGKIYHLMCHIGNHFYYLAKM